jgi:hypothetical protein
MRTEYESTDFSVPTDARATMTTIWSEQTQDCRRKKVIREHEMRSLYRDLDLQPGELIILAMSAALLISLYLVLLMDPALLG